MDLSIVIVSWNVKDVLRNNLKSIFNSKGSFDFEVFVVDNDSADGTAEMVSKTFPSVHLIPNNSNLGFSKANNQAIKKAKGDFILLLNPDMELKEDTLDNMLKWMKENKSAKVASCSLIDEKGKRIPHVRRFPGLYSQLAIILKIHHVFPGILNRYLNKGFNYEKDSKVDSVRGSFFMIRNNEQEKPLLDERYFVWFEEVDFCQRVYKKNQEVWYTPVATCIDKVGKSFEQIPRNITQIYFRDSMLKYFKEWKPSYQYWILKIFWPIGIILTRVFN